MPELLTPPSCIRNAVKSNGGWIVFLIAPAILIFFLAGAFEPF